MEYLTLENLEHVVAAFGALILAATAVVKITPTKADDEVVGKVGGIFQKVKGFLKSLSLVK